MNIIMELFIKIFGFCVAQGFWFIKTIIYNIVNQSLHQVFFLPIMGLGQGPKIILNLLSLNSIMNVYMLDENPYYTNTKNVVYV